MFLACTSAGGYNAALKIQAEISLLQYTLLNTFRRMHLKYENCSLRHILFQTFKQHLHYKRLIATTFDEITIKMKVVSPIKDSPFQISSPIQVTKKKKLLLVVSWSDVHIEFVFARPPFLRARPSAQIKLRDRKNGQVEVNLSSPEQYLLLIKQKQKQKEKNKKKFKKTKTYLNETMVEKQERQRFM